MRPVIDLSSLNKFIVNEHFQMENLSCLKAFLLPGDFMTNVVLKDAYLSVPVHESSRKFLRFICKGICYQFKAFLFGLCSAPKMFYESFKTCCRIPEEEGHSSPYIPGRLSFLGCNSGGSCEEYSAGNDSQSLQSLGFTINLTKSLLIPT